MIGNLPSSVFTTENNPEPNVYISDKPIVFLANTQRYLELFCADSPVDIIVNGVASTLPFGTKITFSDDNLLNKQIEIVSVAYSETNYVVVAIGQKMEYTALFSSFDETFDETFS
jgi:hypothetical protein